MDPDIVLYSIEGEHRQRIRDKLAILGIMHSTIFPDLDGIAQQIDSEVAQQGRLRSMRSPYDDDGNLDEE